MQGIVRFWEVSPDGYRETRLAPRIPAWRRFAQTGARRQSGGSRPLSVTATAGVRMADTIGDERAECAFFHPLGITRTYRDQCY